jgi:hypothetical protein
VVTNTQGRYRNPDVLVGEYDAQVTKSGFQTVVQRVIVLTVRSERVVDFSLQVGQTQATVTVEAQVCQVDTTSAALSGDGSRLRGSLSPESSATSSITPTGAIQFALNVIY